LEEGQRGRQDGRPALANAPERQGLKARGASLRCIQNNFARS
jgi:hypothetical protein